MVDALSFDRLVENVGNVHSITSGAAKGAVNQLLTIRNWVIGYYIVEFEQNGADRAEYGSHLLDNLAKELSIDGLRRLQLNLCRIFYQKYPQICSTACNRLRSIGGIKKLPSVQPMLSHKSELEQEICSTASNVERRIVSGTGDELFSGDYCYKTTHFWRNDMKHTA